MEGMVVKKLLVLFLAVIMVLSLVACGGGSQDVPTIEAESTPTPTPALPPAPVVEDPPDEDADDEIYDDANARTNDPPSYTHTFLDLGLTLGDDWELADRGEDAFITVGGNLMAISILGLHDVNPDWDDLVSSLALRLELMVLDSFNGTDVEISSPEIGSLGYVVSMASYTFHAGGQSAPAMAFMVSDGEQFTLINSIFMDEAPDLIDSLLDFVSSIVFLR